MQAPTSIATAITAIDGNVVKITWTDPNTTTQTARIFTVVNGQATTTEVSCTKSTSGKWAYLTTGTYALALKDANGQQSSSVVFTTDPATTQTAQALLSEATGEIIDVGDKIDVLTFSATVQPDGSLA